MPDRTGLVPPGRDFAALLGGIVFAGDLKSVGLGAMRDRDGLVARTLRLSEPRHGLRAPVAACAERQDTCARSTTFEMRCPSDIRQVGVLPISKARS